MRLAWYAGTSTALAAGVVAYAFNQRANFYSAMVYLSQNNLSLMILINLILLVYSSLVWGLQRLCYGPLRPVEVEQLYEKAWFAVTETCLAMTIFREEVGAWFLVMFTALVTGKVWGWIGEGRVEVLEQQPPTNPRLFHTRLSISLILSVMYDVWLLVYAVKSVIQQARPNMMVMFLFEFAILAAASLRSLLRYGLSLYETHTVNKQTRLRLEERRKIAREQRADIMRRRESGDAAEAEAAEQEDLPDEDDIDEMDIEVPGWESKGHWVLSLDLVVDFIKLCIYTAFFAILMRFYGLPIHIMRDLFLTARSFVKRLNALMRYRRALQDMNKYPDATEEELTREDTCIICREDMRPWDPTAVGAVERNRPKKLPCGHILHFGCLKGWLERQQVCPTCRRSVVVDGAAPNGDAGAAAANGGQPAAPGQAGAGIAGGNAGPAAAPGRPNMRVFQLGPIRLGFAQGNAQNIQDMADRLRMPLDAPNVPPAPTPGPAPVAPTPGAAANVPVPNNTLGGILEMQAQLQEISNRIQQEMYALQSSQAELQTLYSMTAELNRLRQLQQQNQQPALQTLQGMPGITAQFAQQAAGAFGPTAPMATTSTYISQVPGQVVSRHGGAPYSAAIPAGSEELPEGVVIPPGWSLLPLQRLDGQPQPQPLGPQPTPTVQSADIQDQQQETTTTADSSHNSNGNRLSGHMPDVRQHADGQGASDTAQDPVSNPPQAQSEPPAVAAPTPVMPNWGGAAQLFSQREAAGSSNGPRSNATHDSSTARGAEPVAATPEGDLEDNEQEETSSTTSKGKGKAVTVEDAAEEE
ncbi:hypothetical protein F4780DRAFT_735676 [Xylariomycetidae sp. FL0641]|nr:hypothetical protein F4780DRAFT_735676 [Xylariomycetidae sp. FL0641]